jgi:anti-sigma regulatory factor (Ser/Thr protein kinase)
MAYLPGYGHQNMYDCVVTLEPAVASVRTGRELVRRTLQWVDQERLDIAVLLADELIANAVDHGAPPVVLSMTGSADRVVVAVTDAGPGRPVVRTHDTEAVRGRGMMLVDRLADAWGVDPLTPGKRVWFEVRSRHPDDR